MELKKKTKTKTKSDSISRHFGVEFRFHRLESIGSFTV